ncbi:MAG TPA: O-antigen ligase [Alphaproteobacteria bacterium]|nr:O-antigen ligase [Alphaproteobacteria bacterium]
MIAKTETSSATFIRPTFQEKKRPETFPQLPRLTTIAFVTLTVGIMAYAGMFGIYPILLFYGMWFPCIYYKKQFNLRLSKDIRIPLLMASYSILSTLWSGNPDITAKGALESATMILVSILAARITTLESFLKGMSAGSALVLVASLINGTHRIDDFSGDYSLVGLFASKNQLGLNAEIGAFIALLIVFARVRFISKIIYGFIPLGIALISLYLSRSATSIASLMATVAVCMGAYVLAKFPKRVRKPALIAGFIFAVILALTGILMGWEKLGFSAFGKDTTLTGRTLLWAEGINFGMQSPILGVGYGDFWVPGRQLAEALWYKFQIFGRMGFHFHDTYIQNFVDLGIFGVLLMAGLFWSCCAKSFQYITRHEADVLAYYALGISFMFLIRSFVEIDIGGTFGIGPFLLMSVLPRLTLHQSTLKLNDPPKPDPLIPSFKTAKAGHG